MSEQNLKHSYNYALGINDMKPSAWSVGESPIAPHFVSTTWTIVPTPVSHKFALPTSLPVLPHNMRHQRPIHRWWSLSGTQIYHRHPLYTHYLLTSSCITFLTLPMHMPPRLSISNISRALTIICQSLLTTNSPLSTHMNLFSTFRESGMRPLHLSFVLYFS